MRTNRYRDIERVSETGDLGNSLPPTPWSECLLTAVTRGIHVSCVVSSIFLPQAVNVGNPGKK